MMKKEILTINNFEVFRYNWEYFVHYFFWDRINSNYYEWVINSPTDKIEYYMLERLDGYKEPIKTVAFYDYESAEKFVLNEIEKITSKIISEGKNGKN